MLTLEVVQFCKNSVTSRAKGQQATEHQKQPPFDDDNEYSIDVLTIEEKASLYWISWKGKKGGSSGAKKLFFLPGHHQTWQGNDIQQPISSSVLKIQEKN